MTKRLKNTLGVILTVLLCVTMFLGCRCEGVPPRYWGDTIEKGGRILDDLRYNDDGANVRIIRYEGTGGTVTIPTVIDGMPVTDIRGYAFCETKLTGITIPNGVIRIAHYAFCNNKLAEVIIPDSILSIKGGVFKGNQLTFVSISNNVTSIEESCFKDNKLANISIPENIFIIEANAFTNNQLTSITIGANVILYPNSFGNVFENIYNAGGCKLAGTYTREDVTSRDWTRQ